MKAFIWAIFLVLALLWTGLAVTSIGVSDWLLSLLSSGGALSEQVATVSLPAWLNMWVDAQWLEAIRSMLVPIVGMFSAILPSTNTTSMLLTVFIWIVWGLGAAVLLAGAIGAHLFTSRRKVKAFPT